MKANSALLLIDIQNDYFEGGLNELTGSREAGINAQKLLRYFRGRSLPVIHIQHLSNRSDAAFFFPGTKGAEIHPCVTPLETESVITKHTPNSFYRTDLHARLQAKGITELVICGMMIQLCVDATVRAAKDLGYGCTVIQDACATRELDFQGVKIEAENVRNAFFAALAPYYSIIMPAEKYMKYNSTT